MSKCTACNGSGYYDNHGNPECGTCNGNGYIDTTISDSLADLGYIKLYAQERLKGCSPYDKYSLERIIELADKVANRLSE